MSEQHSLELSATNENRHTNDVADGAMPSQYRDPPSGDRRKCIVLVPFAAHIHPECDEGLRALERRGYPVRRLGGVAAIDQGRNQMATDAIHDGFDETMWIDADIGFHPDSVERLRVLSSPKSCPEQLEN